MQSKENHPAFDSVVVITVLTSDPARRDQIDRLIDTAFTKDPRIQTIRVVGYSEYATTVELGRGIIDIATGRAPKARRSPGVRPARDLSESRGSRRRP